MVIKSYNDLEIWKKSMELVVDIYKLTKLLPNEELYGLSSQMRRAAVSIPSNIAEGHSRGFSKEYVRFLTIAMGSRSELRTQLLICEKIDYLTFEQIRSPLDKIDEIGKMGHSLIGKINEYVSKT